MNPATAVQLPEPHLGRERSLQECLSRRSTVREMSARPLPAAVLSNLLWAACGVNRTQGPFGGPGITAASASNCQEIAVYVAMKDGVFLFDAVGHRLLPAINADVRALAISPGQRVTMVAPVHLLYVVDLHRLTHTTGFEEPGLHDPEVQKSYYYVDTGMIAANVYLFAASCGLVAWFHNCDREGLARALKLRPEERVLFAQSVGYPQGSEA